MKTLLLTTSALLAWLAVSAPAQTPSLVNGRKVLLGKNGQAVAQPPVTQLPTAPLVGGADSCVTPDAITGTGSFPFDCTTASSGPQNQTEPICLDYNTMGINADVWFKWTATFSGNAEVLLCGGTGMDSRVAVYAGTTCPTAGSALACNDDYCGLTSKVNFLCTSGNSYVIQLGTYPGVLGQTGTFSINPFTAPAGDDCGSPIVVPGPGTYNFDTLPATTSFQGQGEAICIAANSSQIDDDTWFAYTAGVNGLATVSTCGLTPTSPSLDSRIAAYTGPGCPTLNSAIACNDDDASCPVVPAYNSTMSFSITCGQVYLLQIGRYSNSGASVNGQFTITESGSGPCSTPGTPYCFGDGTGTACPCANNGAAGNGCASSVNVSGANLTNGGTANLASDTLVLQGSGMPNSACLYFQGTTQISSAFGDGLRCAGGAVTRLGTKTNVSGASQYPVGADAPVHVKGNVTAPGTRTYQAWYRNAAAFCTPSTFNLSNGMLITWI
jgi:hypothetical protein